MRYHRNRRIDPLIHGDPTKPLPTRLASVYNTVADQLGMRAENLVEKVMKAAKEGDRLPEWLTGWERSERYSRKDRSGIDFTFFTTDAGELHINVKSSVGGAEHFKQRHRGDTIRPIVVDVRKSDKVIYDIVLGVLDTWRIQKRLKK